MAPSALPGRDAGIAYAKALRKTIPRTCHAPWPTFADRPDPVKVLEQSHEARLSQLAPVRWGRMVASPFAFLRRASANSMAWELAQLPKPSRVAMSPVPAIAHLCNFGAVRHGPARRLIFAVRDFDVTTRAVGVAAVEQHDREHRDGGAPAQGCRTGRNHARRCCSAPETIGT